MKIPKCPLQAYRLGELNFALEIYKFIKGYPDKVNEHFVEELMCLIDEVRNEAH
jgi:hypothetical protein